MIGRTPEYLKQRLGARHMKSISLYILALPATILIGTAVAMALPGERGSMLNAGPHGLSEVLYAFTSSAANNGSAFAGFSGNTTWYNIALALAMVVGRFLPIVAVLAIAGTFAAQRPGVITSGTLRRTARRRVPHCRRDASHRRTGVLACVGARPGSRRGSVT